MSYVDEDGDLICANIKCGAMIYDETLTHCRICSSKVSNIVPTKTCTECSEIYTDKNHCCCCECDKCFDAR